MDASNEIADANDPRVPRICSNRRRRFPTTHLLLARLPAKLGGRQTGARPANVFLVLNAAGIGALASAVFGDRRTVQINLLARELDHH